MDCVCATAHQIEDSNSTSEGSDLSTNDPIALDAYEQIAEAFAQRIDTKGHNAHYDRPAIRSLLPPVSGRRVLDAGCGPGVYTEWLVSEGADVVGVDVSPKMVQLATARLQGRARIQRADLGKPLDFLDDGSFEIVVSPLTLDYVWNWDRVFSEFFRVLRVGGHFIFSVSHPSDEFYEHHP